MNTDSTAGRLLRAADRAEAQERKYLARKRVNRVALALSLAAMAFGVFWLVWILWSTIELGIGGIMLGLGRAIGETMAVTFVIGNFNQLDSLSLFAAANSITSALANEFAEAGSGMHQAALIYLGLVLFFITFVVLSLSKLLLARLRRNEGGRT